MFKCDGGKVGEKIVSNDSSHVVAFKRGSTIQEPCDESIGTVKTTSTLSSRSRRSKKLQARRSQIVDASFKGTSVSTDVVPSKQQQMKKEPITIVASTVRGRGGFMIPIDEMNDLRPFDEENGVELQLVEDHTYYLSKIDNEIMQHQRRVERELRKSRRARHRSGISSSSGSGSSCGSGSGSCRMCGMSSPCHVGNDAMGMSVDSTPRVRFWRETSKMAGKNIAINITITIHHQTQTTTPSTPPHPHPHPHRRRCSLPPSY